MQNIVEAKVRTCQGHLSYTEANCTQLKKLKGLFLSIAVYCCLMPKTLLHLKAPGLSSLLISNKLTRSIEQNSLREASSLSASHEISRILSNLIFSSLFTTARHLSLPGARLVHSTSFQFISLLSVIVLSSSLLLDLSSGLFALGFPTKTLYAFLSSPTRAVVQSV